ncbi:MAG: protein translocase subunit SecD [Sarcina sp.]
MKKRGRKTQSKGSSIALLLIAVIVIGFFAVAGFKGIEIGGYQFKPFEQVITKGLDLQGGVSVVMEIQKPDVTTQELDRVKNLLALRVNKVGVAETVVTTEGSNKIRIDIPGKYDSNNIVNTLSQTGNLDFIAPNGSVILTGKDVEKATAYIQQENGQPVVGLKFNETGKTAFANATKEYVGQSIKIQMDGETLTDPTVQNPILNGEAVITGMSSMQEADRIAGIINAGALPVPVKEVSVQTIGAQLGANALPNAMKAGAVGIAIIFLFLIVFYRVPGVAASLALLGYILLVLYTFIAVKVTLTLPGIAAFLLTVGMAVDSNVLIFERTKEELRLGRPVRAAIKSGFSNAMSSIIDSNITTIIAGLVLYFLGSGPVKGFAITLLIGIIMSLFTSIVVTRFFMNVLFGVGVMGKPSLFGVNLNKVKEKKPLKIINKAKITFAISLIIIVIGFGFMFTKGLNFGIDFRGGTQITINMENPNYDKAKADQIVHQIDPSAVTNTVNSDQYEIKASSLDTTQIHQMVDAVQKGFDLKADSLVSENQIGASIGKQLTQNSIIALIVALACVLIYVIIRFETNFGIAAILALIHDVLITVTVFAVFRLPVNSPFIAAILTIVGYSIMDTIVIFDRIRHNRKKMGAATSTEIANKSITETLTRSINTTFTTLVTIGCVYIFVPSVRDFALPLLIGIACGAYSSIFIASPVWCLLNKINKKKNKKK